LSGISLGTISEEMILQRYAELSKRGKTTASRHMRFLRALFSFAQSRYTDAVGNPILTNNPVLVLTKLKVWHRASRRRTYITESELSKWFDAVTSLRRDEGSEFTTTAMDYLQFLLLTGLRREEAARLTWDRVDLVNRTFTVTDTKNRNDHILPLSNYLTDLLKARNDRATNVYVFSGNGPNGHLVNVYKHIENVTSISGVKFCLHDLRRTYATAADTLDLSDSVVKRLLNHSLPTDVTSGYIVNGVQRLRQPMQRITDYLLSQGGVRSSVVAFPTVLSSVTHTTSVEA
jgi:integrase